jgi:hypothetical protein
LRSFVWISDTPYEPEEVFAIFWGEGLGDGWIEAIGSDRHVRVPADFACGNEIELEDGTVVFGVVDAFVWPLSPDQG